MKIKLFTHTDLDGIGCAILAYLAFGRENVDVEYCDYSNVDEKVMEWFKNNTSPYKRIYITDISINEETAAEIDSRSWREKVLLFDHHATALWLNKYDWCKVKIWYDDGIPTSGTELFFNYLTYHAYICPANTPLHIGKNIQLFVEIVRDYDTWRWKEELGDEGIICKQVNDLFYIYGRDEFIAWALNNIHGWCVNSPVFRFPTFSEIDRALLEQRQKDIDIYVEQNNKQMSVLLDSFGREYGVVFAERYFSELGNRLCELHPELALDHAVCIDGQIFPIKTKEIPIKYCPFCGEEL